MVVEKHLRDLKATYKRKDILLPAVERHVKKMAAQEPDDRRSDIMHPSEMAKYQWCPTHDYFRITGAVAGHKESVPSFRMENVWDYGHSVHRKWQRWLGDMGILYGKWYCRVCDYSWFGMSPQRCPNCSHSERIKYKEVPFDLPELMLAGHGDGIVFLDDEFLMIEIKSIGINTLRFEYLSLYERYQNEQLTPEELWFLINRPFPSHLRQGLIYLFLARRCYPDLDIKKMVFIYEWKPTQETKEFVVPYSEGIIRNVLEGVDAVVNAVPIGQPPDRPAWAAIEGKACKSCEYRTNCWGAAFPQASAPSPAPVVRVRRVSADKRRRAVRPSA